MAIDVFSEDVISLTQASRLLPKASRNGSRPHLSTLIRWVLDGALSPEGTRVKLEAVRLGGKWLTSREAINRFADALTPQSDSDRPLSPTPSQRERAAIKAGENLEAAGA